MKYDASLQKYFDATGIENGIDRAVNYPLKEIALLTVAPGLFGCGATDYVYHRGWPVYENFIAGKYDGHCRPELGFRIVANQSVPA